MRVDAKASQALVAIARAIEAVFSKGDWLMLGLITDSQDVITGHRRLLRSLEWGDEDYSGNVLEVLPSILGARRARAVAGGAAECFPNLRVVEEHIGLEP